MLHFLLRLRARDADGLILPAAVLLNGLGIDTGIDMDQLISAGQRICNVLGKANGSRVARALIAKRVG